MRDLRHNKFEQRRKAIEDAQLIKLRNHPHVPSDFDWEEYLNAFPHLRKKGVTNEFHALRHWVKSGRRLGQDYRQIILEQNSVNAAPQVLPKNRTEYIVIDPKKRKKTGRTYQFEKSILRETAFIVHIWYHDVFEKHIEPHIHQYRNSSSFFFNFVKGNESPSLVEYIKTTYKNSVILYSENEGRDIRGYFNCLSYINKNNLSFESYVFLHTKNQHLGPRAVTCLKSTLRDTVQYPETLVSALEILKHDDSVGMIGSHEMKQEGFWTDEEKIKTYYILNEFGYAPDKIEFFEGTMFIVKAKIFDKFFRSQKVIDKYVGMFYEDGSKHSGWHHAWERVFPTLVTIEGYDLMAFNSNETKEYQKLISSKVKKNVVLLHLYYMETWDMIKPYLMNIDDYTDLYVNLVEENYDIRIEEEIKETFPMAKIIVSSNIGRDWGGFYRLSKIIDLSSYNACFVIHGKRSYRENKPSGDKWRNELLSSLLEDKQRFKQVTEIIQNGRYVVASQKHLKNDPVELGKNAPWLKTLSERLDIEYDGRYIPFSAGGMFAIKGKILAEIFSAITINDFEREEKLDGLLPHALERFIFVFTECVDKNQIIYL